jgi:hypothetical protein
MLERRLVALAVAGLVVAGCDYTPITQGRIEGAIAPTFANLVHVQMSWLGMPPMAVSEFGVKARCTKPSGQHAGSGEWMCAVTWQGPNGRRIRDTYEVFITTEGCYTATASTESVGGPTLKAEDGRDVRNLLYAFDGCFDTT